MKFNLRFLLAVSFLLVAQGSIASSGADYQLSPPPVVGSEEDKKDFAVIHEYQDTRTQKECEIANLESSPTLKNLFGPQTGVLSADELSLVSAQANRWLIKALKVADEQKEKYRRPRPYKVDLTIHPCIRLPGGSKAYPSAHAPAGYVLAEILSKRLPAKRDKIITQGKKIGENRILGGVHHPSDVVAGQELGRQILMYETVQ